MFSRVLTQVTHVKLAFLPTPTRPVHLLSSSARCTLPLSLLLPPLSPSLCYSFQARSGFLEYIFGLLNSWYSASQLLLAPTQTATNW
ncbi:unnamed protein product [Hymenolepis diminuta]|uniref:Uncharacterized protein n=1 Tax=Hymenolepis diminuta TaxID=6216 RepID=A0A564XXI0_HYMDI|nr:unnamed protein product [Hymenolepis diminuta]